MVVEFMKIAGLVLFTHCAFLSGVFFISGQLLPVWLSGIYAHSGIFSRTIAASIVFFPLGNFVLASAYKHFNPAWVTPLSLTASVLVTVIFTVMILNAKPPLWIVPAMLTVIAGCVWVSILLGKSPPPP